MSSARAAFCTKCGSPIADNAQFCTKCGARRSEAPIAENRGAPSAAAAGPSASSVAAPGIVASASGAMGMAGALSGAAIALPWQTIVAGQPVDVAGLTRAAAPSLLALAPRPNLRNPAIAVAVTLASDVLIALVSGGAVNPWMLGARLLSGGLTSVLGLITRGRGGGIRFVTVGASVFFGLAQLVSLVAGAGRLFSSAGSWLSVLPSVITLTAGLVAAISTVIAGVRK